jgi:MFS family permease
LTLQPALTRPDTSARSELNWYNFALITSVAAGGIQGVLFPWLITVHLALPPYWVGVAQMASSLPTLLFVLWGGAIADRVEVRARLIRLQLALNLPHLGLVVVLLAGALEYWIAIVYILGPGIISAFMMPARDVAITRIAVRAKIDLVKAITAATGLQFGGQIIGFAMGGLASETGPVPLLCVQVALNLVSVYGLSRIHPQPPLRQQSEHGAIITEIMEGLDAVRRNDRIWPALVLLGASSLFIMGVYMVGMPLMIRDAYGGGSGAFALMNAAFMGGVMAGTMTLSRLKPVHRQGRLVMCMLVCSWTALFLLSFQPPQWAFYLIMLCWGVTGGISMSTSRALVQESADPAMRARVISVYQLAQMGGGPIGSLIVGVLIGAFGLKVSFLVPLGAIALVWLSVLLFTPLWGLTRESRA